jgi:hypothetical protein
MLFGQTIILDIIPPQIEIGAIRYVPFFDENSIGLNPDML